MASNGKNSKRQSIKKSTNKKDKTKKTGSKLSANARGPKKVNGSKPKIKPKTKAKAKIKKIAVKKVLYYKDKAGRVRNKKTGEYIKGTKKFKDAIKKTLDKKKAVKKITKKSAVSWVQTTNNENLTTLRPIVLNSLYENKKIVIFDIFGGENTTKSNKNAIEIIEDNNAHFWNIIDIIREMTAIESPQYYPEVIERIDTANRKIKNGVAVKNRILKIDYRYGSANTNVDKGLFDSAIKYYKREL